MTQAARVIGSHQDRKGRQKQAKLSSLARYTLFTMVEQQSLSGSGSEVELFRKTYDQAIIRNIGDTVLLEMAGSFLSSVDSKQIHIKIENEAGVPLAIYDSPVITTAALPLIAFSLRAAFFLLNTGRLGREVTFLPDAAATNVVIGSSVVPYAPQKFSIAVYGTGTAAGQVTANVIRAEFLPGKGLDL